MISRRSILRAAGAAVALPVLHSLHINRARSEVALPGTKRFVALFFPNGTSNRTDWVLEGEGTNYTMGTAHAPLAPFQSSLSMFRGLNGNCGGYTCGAPSHARGTVEFLGGGGISAFGGATPAEASIDQVMVNELRPNTPIRSLHLGPNAYPAGPPSDTGAPTSLTASIAWTGRDAPISPLESARVAFDQVFVPLDTDPAITERRRQLRQSVLDHTLDQVDSLNARLNARDRARLDEYLTSVRDVESRLQAPTGDGCGTETARPDAGLDFPTHTRAMLDIIALALRCDATRFVTYSMDYGFGEKNFSFLGIGDYNHHTLTHSGRAESIIAAHREIILWYMEQIAYFLAKLRDSDESGDTMLDNSIVYIGSDHGDPFTHSHDDLPIIVAGGGAGALRPGRLIDGTGVHYAKVLLGLAHAMGAPIETFAGVTTPFDGL